MDISVSPGYGAWPDPVVLEYKVASKRRRAFAYAWATADCSESRRNVRGEYGVVVVVDVVVVVVVVDAMVEYLWCW
jgi:hypothetical protein